MRSLGLLLLLLSCARPPGGRDGRDGRSCTATGLDGQAVVACTDGTTAKAPELDGPPGNQGRQGPQGEEGHRGLAQVIAVSETCPTGGIQVTTDLGGAADSEHRHTASLCLPGPACPTEGLPGDTQLADPIDLRRFLLAGCQAVSGDLTVGPDAGLLRGDLLALSHVQKVGGTLRLQGAQLDSLEGLGSLQEIGGDLVLGCRLQVRDISALYALGCKDCPGVKGNVRVSESDWGELLRTELDGHIGGQIYVEPCPR